jgi:histidinol-phosphate phosphatase family protein
MKPSFDIVIPTLGRPSLQAVLDALAVADGPRPGRIVVARDGGTKGPAAARNSGWRAADAEWVVFLDDDVLPDSSWLADLEADLAGLPGNVAASQGRIRVPLPDDRRPTDWERNVKALEDAQWVTADMAVRREALAAVGGFDERFQRAYREDTDLVLRLVASGRRIVRGRRVVTHPIREEGPFVSVRLQAGNADDALMDALHSRAWRRRAGADRGRFSLHLATTAVGAGAVVLAPFRRGAAALALAAWLGATAELAWSRIAPGPRTAREIAAMVATSVLIPPAATYHRLVGKLRARRLLRADPERKRRPRAVLFDRDGTLIVNVPYNGDPERVVPMPGARAALDRLRRAGVPMAVVSNQSGVGRGMLTRDDVDRVAARVEQLLGPLGPWVVCPHGPDDGCTCRKPAPGLVQEAARTLGVEPADCVVIGDIGSDVAAAHAAGARAILVPTDATRREEIEAAPEVAADLERAVELALGGSQ